MSATLPRWLVYCRAGFERDCAHETQAQVIEAAPGTGFVVLAGKPRLSFDDLVFARQLIRLQAEVALPAQDRLTPLLEAVGALKLTFGALWLEVPDTNEGKQLSGFSRRLAPLLEEKLREQGRLEEGKNLPRLHVFFPDNARALIGTSDLHNSSAYPSGILRLKMPTDAPSRSYLKLAEAFEVFLSREEQAAWLKPGMHAVDLGAAPGGWTWQLVRRGLKVVAVDNGPMKGAAANHPAIRHVRADGFSFRPKRPVDWLVCDMVEKPARIAQLVAQWLVEGHAPRAVFNLKLPMKMRAEAVAEALAALRGALKARGIGFVLKARQLYHDREEVTVFLACKKGGFPTGGGKGAGRGGRQNIRRKVC